MKDDVNSVYILTPEELTVIAAGKNIQQMFGIRSGKKIIDETVVCQALNHLYKKEFIHNAKEEAFILDNYLRELITVIDEAKSLVLIRHFANPVSIKVIYVGKKLVATEQRQQDKSSIRIYEIPWAELEDFLQEDMLVEEGSYRSILDEEQLIFEGIQKKHILQEKEVGKIGNIVTVIEKLTLQSNTVSCRMIAKQEKNWLKYTHKEKELVSLEEEEVLDNIADMIKEEANDIS